MFKVIQMPPGPRSADAWWAVFLVNPNDEKDRYMVTSPLDKREQAEHFQKEFTRIQGTSLLKETLGEYAPHLDSTTGQ
jgi:hypothetical protein